ncbi:armadillo-type protein [Baffinella frigidus]|nr:armadillo-type protein [Cryptophyta sp. CCMP2293]
MESPSGAARRGASSDEESQDETVSARDALREMKDLLVSLGETETSDPRATFPLVRQIVTIAERRDAVGPGMPSELSLLLLDWMPVLFRASRETNSTVLQNGICRVICLVVQRPTNVPRMLAAGVLELVQPFLTGPHHELRCKALKCLGDLGFADEGCSAMVQTGGQSGTVQAIISCVANCKREEARCAALEALAKLSSSSDEARRKVAQHSGVQVIHSALTSSAANVILGATRALQPLCRTKVVRLELMRLGGLKTLSAVFRDPALSSTCQEGAANVVLALVNMGASFRELLALSARGEDGARKLGGLVAAGWGKLAMELTAMLQQKQESRPALKHLCEKYKLLFFVIGRAVAGLGEALQKTCYSAYVDGSKSGRSSGGSGTRVARAVSICKKVRGQPVQEVSEIAPDLDALPEFSFYKQLQFHRPQSIN